MEQGFVNYSFGKDMENSWQRKSGGSGWQSLPEQQQIQISGGNVHLHSTARMNPGSHFQSLVPEAVSHWSPGLNVNQMGVPGQGPSFLSLLSSEVAMNGVHAQASGGGAIVSEGSRLSSVPFTGNVGARHAEVGRVSVDQGSGSVPKFYIQGLQRDLQPLDIPKTDAPSELYSNQTQMNFPDTRGGYLCGANDPNVQKNHAENTFQASYGVLWKNGSSVSSLPSTVLTAGPRVFCLGLSGNLLCNSGLLGIICTCHGLHMSIAKFSEHSGSRNVNPGTAVHVDGGETIAHWRKEYFLKLGIRVPEDHVGWDWPLGPSVTAGSLQHGETLPKLSKDAHVYSKTSSFGASVDQLSRKLPPKNTQTGENVNEFCHHEKPKSTREDTCSNIKGVSSSANSNLKFASDDHLKGYSRSVCSTMPSCFGPRTTYDLCPPLSSCKDPICESEVPPHWQKLNTMGKDVVTGKSSLVKDMISSHVELRLGQPSQQNQAMASGRSAIAVLGTLPVIHGQPQKSVFSDQPLCITGTSSTEESRQPGYFAGIIPSSSVRTKMAELNDPKLIQGARSNESQLKHVNQNASCSNAASGSFANVRNPYELRDCSELSNGAVKVSPGISMLHFGHSLANSGQSGFSFLQEKTTDSRICIDMLFSQKQQKVEEARKRTENGLHSTAEKKLGTRTKTKAKMLSFCGTGNSNSGGIARDSGHTTCSAEQDKVSNIRQSSNTRASAADPSSTLNYYGQTSYPVPNGSIPSSYETFGSPLELGTVLSSQTFPLGNYAANSISGNSFVASTGNRNTGVGQHFPGESSKMPAFHSLCALPSGILASGTSKTTPVQEESQLCYEKRQTAPQQKNCCNFTNVQSAPEVAMHSHVFANRSNEENGNFTKVTDKWRNFQEPMVSQGCNSHGKNVEARCHMHSDLEQARQLFNRFVSNANATSVQAGNCYQELSCGHILNKCNFSRQSDCIQGRHDSLGNCSAGELRGVDGNAIDSMEPFHGPKLSEACKFTEKGESFAAKSVVHDMKKAEFNTFEWRDVPRKVSKDVNKSNTKGHEKPAYHAQREHEMSTRSSGCSAPAVTQMSIEANKKDSSSVDGAVKDMLVVDEGSRIERCGSSDGNSGRSAEFNGIPSKFNVMVNCSSKESVSNPFYGLKDESWFRDYPNLPGQSSTSFSIQTNNNHWQNLESESLRGKVKGKRLDSSVSAGNKKALKGGADATEHILDAKNKRILSQCDKQRFTGPSSVLENVKRVSRLPSGASRKRGLNHGIQVERTDVEAIFNDQRDFAGASKEIQRKRARLVGGAEGLEREKSSNGIISETTAAVGYNATSAKLVGGFRGRRPVVSGKYGVISNDVTVKPPKIESLRTIMLRAKRCSSGKTGKVDTVLLKESKKLSLNTKKEAKNRVSCMVSAELNSLHPIEGSEESDFSGSEDSCDLSHASKKRRRGCVRSHAILDSEIDSRPKYKKIRTRCLSELAVKGDGSISLKPMNLKDGKSTRSIKRRLFPKANDSTLHTDEECNADKHSKEDSCSKGKNSELSCCVCGTSDTDDCNCILQCNTCLIKVHQACYGISMVPKAPWYCRPCKTRSKNTVCVLCGYGGGAMTRAHRTFDVVKSLLRVWGIATASSSKKHEFSKPLGNSYQMLTSTKPVGESDPALSTRPAQIESSSVKGRVTDFSEHVSAQDIPSSAPDTSVLSNSIIDGVHDSSVKQWVHMVCGLWTPTTRCPNVNTMSAFDVSGASQPNHDAVCSICQRPGGSCIQCRVDYCHVRFHPWCAHEKGLLQSEVEGVDNQSVGFYGRCMLHEMHQQVDPDSNGSRCAGQVERESTCARTEGYKGRKRDGFQVNCGQKGGGGCLVSQEQLDAWTYINGLKSRARGPPRLPTSVVEYDCRKEYGRYKQSRAWKQLVVYKSGIHGLGLYTCQFIPRGAMVVEYVGEIVGGHVADKREAEYQAGKKVQYKSACYFFRIDKEHIIDATRKGGIARFVNHSCAPNCVAKVISVRADKKVIFLAERDMYPGEEVTYDYHFNHEDEGKKLPCYCNAKNCSRYLN